jgi:hypothetical protein
MLDCDSSLDKIWVGLVVVSIGEDLDIEAEVTRINSEAYVLIITGSSIKAWNEEGNSKGKMG